MFFCMLVFIGWSITKDISQETEKQKLNAAIIKQQKVIEELNKNNIELRKALKNLLDATAPRKTKSEA